jgi:hypothetical protein
LFAKIAPMTAAPLILLAAGGTGGHLFPAEALAHALGRRGVTVDLATDERAERYGSFLVALMVAAEITLPHWVGRFLGAIREYQVSDADLPITELLLPRFAGRLATFGLICLLIVLLWRWRGSEEGSETFNLGIAWAAAVTLAVLPKLAAYNQLLLIPALIVLLGRWQDTLNGGLITRSLAKAAVASQVWQWIAALGLAVCSLAISPRLARSAAEAPLYTLLALPPLVLAAVALLTLSRKFAPGNVPHPVQR